MPTRRLPLPVAPARRLARLAIAAAAGAASAVSGALSVPAAGVMTVTAIAVPALAQTPMQSRLSTGPQSLPREQAQAALQRGDAGQALAIADSALATFPSDARLRFTRAMALYRLNRLAEAEEAFASMTLEFPELPEPYNNLAVVRSAQGKLELARAALEDAIRAMPSYAPAHENLAEIYLQLAARNLTEASRLEPGNAALAARAKSLAELASAGSRTAATVSPTPTAGPAPEPAAPRPKPRSSR